MEIEHDTSTAPPMPMPKARSGEPAMYGVNAIGENGMRMCAHCLSVGHWEIVNGFPVCPASKQFLKAKGHEMDGRSILVGGNVVHGKPAQPRHTSHDMTQPSHAVAGAPQPAVGDLSPASTKVMFKVQPGLPVEISNPAAKWLVICLEHDQHATSLKRADADQDFRHRERFCTGCAAAT